MNPNVLLNLIPFQPTGSYGFDQEKVAGVDALHGSQAAEAVAEFFRSGQPDTHLEWRVDNDDGQAAKRFTPDGDVEVWVSAIERPNDAARQAGLWLLGTDGRPCRRIRVLMIPLSFDTYAEAEAVAGLLASTFTAARDMLALFRYNGPDCDTRGHRVRLERFSRRLNSRAVCERCMTVLVEDVDPLEYEAISAASGVTVAKLIERQVNQ